MRLLSYKSRGFDREIAKLNRQAEPSAEVRETVVGIIADIRTKGDAALCSYTAKFGGPKLTPARLRVSPAEIRKASSSLTPAVRKALAASLKTSPPLPRRA